MRISDWSSDVCSSDLPHPAAKKIMSLRQNDLIAINLFIALAIIRYRHRKGHRADYEPENAALEKRLTLWTGIGIAGMLAPGLEIGRASCGERVCQYV